MTLELLQCSVFSSASEKLLSENPLIPLPPTGFASVFCAKVRLVQSAAQPRPAGGAVGRMAVSQSAKFCEGVQPGFKTDSRDAGGRGMGISKVY